MRSRAPTNTGSTSSGRRTSRGASVRPRCSAAVRASLQIVSLNGRAAFQRNPTRTGRGENSLTSSNPFAATSCVISVTPVTRPPGRARLETRPYRRASPTPAMTIGVSLVALRAARAAGCEAATITSTFRRASSMARSSNRSTRPCAYLRSKAMFWPSTQPRSRSVSAKAVHMGTISGAVSGVLPR
jgi:hypothetical protein